MDPLTELLNRERKHVLLPKDGEPYTIADVARKLDELRVKYILTGWWSFVLRDLTTEEPWVVWFFNDRFDHDEPLSRNFVASLFKVPRELLTFGYERMLVYGYRLRVARISRAVLDIAYINCRVGDPEKHAPFIAGFLRCCRRNHVYRYIDKYPPYVKKAVDAAYRLID